jgi:phytoene dehydrogenase-like protein
MAAAIFSFITPLTALIRWKTAGLEDVALIHLAESIDSVSKSSNEAERGMLPETPTICVGQPHRLDPTRCPEGKSDSLAADSRTRRAHSQRRCRGKNRNQMANGPRQDPGGLCRPY